MDGNYEVDIVAVPKQFRLFCIFKYQKHKQEDLGFTNIALLINLNQ